MRKAAEIEGRQGVKEMEDFLWDRAPEWARYNAAHAKIRISMMKAQQKKFLRARRQRIYDALRLRGVGGISTGAGGILVKCLHLQLASYIGMGHHPAQEWLDASMGEWNCTDGVCLPEYGSEPEISKKQEGSL
jgi:hypothetical protein